ncbi:hypothetical protein CA54_16990 [Symmachiella macrocystis]|uniref:Loader and inhibitor of phage G40P n=1 Tax=Symmachiella macrocystis TaxID=2527985 RepID=A0A5C6BL41_9PLAN|nr:hypothetical protein [Symmachiella macrocystis]TWU12873.1 hypothetical protein CA54_16990 [Symmachiella macrocystis]
MTRGDFARVYAHLVAAVGRPASKEQAEAWFFAMEDLTAGQFAAGVRRWMQEIDSGFPSIAAVRSMAIESTEGVLPDAAAAWQSVLTAMSRYGYYKIAEGVASLDQLTLCALGGSGGFRRLCDCQSDQLPVIAAQFRRAYESRAVVAERQRKLSADVRPVSAIEVRQRRIESPAAALAKRLTCAEDMENDSRR